MTEPFRLRYQDLPGIITGANRFTESGEGGPFVVASLEPFHRSYGFADEADRHALGRLMAAAPEMLAELKKAANFVSDELAEHIAGTESENEMRQWLARMEAAIAKAEGRADA